MCTREPPCSHLAPPAHKKASWKMTVIIRESPFLSLHPSLFLSAAGFAPLRKPLLPWFLELSWFPCSSCPVLLSFDLSCSLEVCALPSAFYLPQLALCHTCHSPYRHFMWACLDRTGQSSGRPCGASSQRGSWPLINEAC